MDLVVHIFDRSRNRCMSGCRMFYMRSTYLSKPQIDELSRPILDQGVDREVITE